MKKNSLNSVTQRRDHFGDTSEGSVALLHPTQVSAEWLPESALRDALIREKLPAALASKTLFWINIRQYLAHQDAQLPPEDYLQHWREIYERCLNQDPSHLPNLSYVSFERPLSAQDVN